MPLDLEVLLHRTHPFRLQPREVRAHFHLVKLTLTVDRLDLTGQVRLHRRKPGEAGSNGERVSQGIACWCVRNTPGACARQLVNMREPQVGAVLLQQLQVIEPRGEREGGRREEENGEECGAISPTAQATVGNGQTKVREGSEKTRIDESKMTNGQTTLEKIRVFQ